MAGLTHAGRDPELPGERGFGVLFAIVGLVAAMFAWRAGSTALVAASVLAALAFAAFAWLAPARLAPLNRAWFRLGLLLAKVVNPIVLGVLFFFVITPYALVLRLFGRDLLGLKPRPDVASYWIERDPSQSPADGFERQY